MAIDCLLRLFDSLELVGALDDFFWALHVALIDKIDTEGGHKHRSGCDIGGSTTLSVTDAWHSPFGDVSILILLRCTSVQNETLSKEATAQFKA